MGKHSAAPGDHRTDTAAQQRDSRSGHTLRHAPAKSPDDHGGKKQGDGTKQKPGPAGFDAGQGMALDSAAHLLQRLFGKRDFSCHEKLPALRIKFG